MKTQTTEIEGIVIIEPQVFGDSRGYFMETYQKEKYAAAGIDVTFVQDNESMSRYGVVRGLHYQAEPFAQAKLIRVVSGRVLDVAVDIRKDSPTFGKVFTLELSSENKLQLFLPHGIAHGFAVLSETAVFTYKCDNFYAPQYERTIRGGNWYVDSGECRSANRCCLPPSSHGNMLGFRVMRRIK